MAKKRSGRSSHHRKHRGRRVGAMGANMSEVVKTFAGVFAGYVAGNYLMNNLLATTSTTVKGGVSAVGGLFLASKSKNGIMKGVGLGLAVVGGKTLASGFGMTISGMPMVGASNLFLANPVRKGLPMSGVGDGITTRVGGVGDGITAKVGRSNSPTWASLMP